MMPTTEETTKRSRSKKPKKIDVHQAEAEKEEAIKTALANERKKWEEEKEEESFGTGLFEGEEEVESEDEVQYGFQASSDAGKEAFDIFQYAQKEYEEKGQPVVFYIKKDNEIMGQLPAPCDWTVLQKKYGGGIYQVTARHAYNKTYIRSQTERVGEPERSPDNKKDPIVISAPQAPTTDLNEMFKGMSSMFMQMQEMASREKAREERDEKRSSESFNTTFLNLITNQQKATTDMMLKIAEMSNTNAKTQSENFAKVIEKMDDKFTKMFEKLADTSSKKESIGTLELIELMNSSRKDGIDTMTTLMELAEARAEAMAGSGDGESKESLLASLVKGFAPILAQANKSMATSQPRGPLTRGALPQTPTPQVAARRPQAPNQAVPQRAPHKPVAQGSGVQIQKNDWRNSLGLSSIADTDDSVGSDLPVTPQSLTANNAGQKVNLQALPAENESVDIEIPDRETNDLYQNASMTQKLIAELTIPTIATYLFEESITPTDVAHICLKDLSGQGISPEVVLKEFNFDFLLQIAGSFGVAEGKKEWFEEFYATIEDSAGVGAVGEEEPTLN